MEWVNYARPEPICWLHHASGSLSSGLALNSCVFTASTLSNARSYMFRKTGPSETWSNMVKRCQPGILMKLHETLESELCPLKKTSHAWCHWRDAEVHRIHETLLSLRAHSAPSPENGYVWRAPFKGTGSQHSESYPTCHMFAFVAFTVGNLHFGHSMDSMERSKHRLTQHSLLKATQLPGVLFLSDRRVEKSPIQNVSASFIQIQCNTVPLLLSLTYHNSIHITDGTDGTDVMSMSGCQMSCPSRSLRSIEARRGSGDGLVATSFRRRGRRRSAVADGAEALATRSPAAGAPECSAAIPTACGSADTEIQNSQEIKQDLNKT